jgi:cysteine desulfurase
LSINFDNMAATPIDPRVADRHRSAMLAHPGNAHSAEHAMGVEAQRALDRASGSVLRALGLDAEDITFTPGASAALWLAVEDAIARVARRPARVAATAVEHPALLAALRRAERDGRISLTIVPVNEAASPRLDEIESALSDGADLLCTMAANNEVGTISNLGPIAALAARFGTRQLIDASQAAGRIELSDAMTADLVVVSGAKMYGPRRAGGLIGKLHSHVANLAHDLFGSPDVASAVALAYAVELRVAERDIDEPRLAAMRDALEARLLAAVPGLRVNGEVNCRIAGSLHVSTPHLPGDAVVGRLWGRVAVSTGAACQSGVPGPSHVLTAMGLPEWVREGGVRIGLGRFNTEDEVEEAGGLIAAAMMAAETVRKRA